MPNWYPRYESQCWYTNTFLVNRFREIGRAAGEMREWNNIYGSGCNFVCIAMMLGLNPAYLASLLAAQRFFRADRSTPARLLAGSVGGRSAQYLVWDDNRPYPEGDVLEIQRFWHPYRGRTTCRLRLLAIKTARTLSAANAVIAAARRARQHVICGYDDHSHLVAGMARGGYFLWDPVSDERHWHFRLAVEDNVAGRYSLRRFFLTRRRQREFRGLPVQFWIYDLRWRP